MLRGHDAHLKRIIAAGITVILLLCMLTASASTAGTASDPLISLSYLDGAFSSSLKTDISQIFYNAAAKAESKFDEIYKKYAGYSFAPGFTQISLQAGETIMLSMGSSFILLSGTVTLSTVYGTIINISTGYEVAADASLTQYQRYFCAENTTATITANIASLAQVDGYYLTDAIVISRYHPVFNDIKNSDWYYQAVDYVYKNNLFGGTSPNTFSPSAPMTRGMFVAVLYRLEGEPATGTGGQFADVRDASLYYYDAVTWANSNNIVMGYSNNAFGPNDPVTREQMAAIIYRYAEYKQRDMSAQDSTYNTFPDRGDISAYAVSAMRWSVSRGILNGSDGKLLPRNTATRAQVAQIVSNYCAIFG